MLPPLSSHPHHPYINSQNTLLNCDTPKHIINEKHLMHQAATTSTTGQSINSQQFKSYFSKNNNNNQQSHQGEVILSSTERGQMQHQEPLLLLKEKKHQQPQYNRRNSNEVLQTLRSRSITENQQMTKCGSKTEFPELNHPAVQNQQQLLTRHNTNEKIIKKSQQ